MKKIITILLGILALPVLAYAINITVPSAPTSGYYLVSTTTGQYLASSTPFFTKLLFNNATGTSATTTNFFSTTASSTNLFGAFLNGFGLTSCTGTNALTWTGGIFSCTAQAQGTVTSVSGTTNRVTSTGGATPVIDISASYIGQSSITTVGTLSSGAVPASLITSGTFGSGNYIFPAQLQVNSSTTLQNFTAINSTTTNATTTSSFATNDYSTTASSTTLNANTSNIGTLTVGSCTGCGGASGFSVFSTTTTAAMATTTIRTSEIPAGTACRLNLDSPYVGGTASDTAQIWLKFNGDGNASYNYDNTSNWAAPSQTDGDTAILVSSQNSTFAARRFLQLDFTAPGGMPIMGTGEYFSQATTTGGNIPIIYHMDWNYKTTNTLTQIELGFSNQAAVFGTSTKEKIACW